MEGRFLLDIIVGERATVFELLSSENQPLLLRGNAFLILNFCLDISDSVVGFDIEGDSLSREGLDKDLHGTTTEAKHKMKSRFLLDIIVGERATVFELLSSENQPLLLGGNAFLILNLGLDVRDSIIRFDIEGDSLSGQSFHEDLHGTTTEAKHPMKSRLLLDIVVGEGATVFELLS